MWPSSAATWFRPLSSIVTGRGPSQASNRCFSLGGGSDDGFPLSHRVKSAVPVSVHLPMLGFFITASGFNLQSKHSQGGMMEAAGEVPAQPNWLGGWYGRLAGKATLVLVVATATSKRYGTLPITDHMLRSFVHGLDMHMSRGTSAAISQQVPLEVVSTSTGLTVRGLGEPDGPLLAYIPAAHIHGEAPTQPGHVGLLVSRRPPTEFRNLGDLIRAQDGLVPRGLVRFTPLWLEQSKRYHYIGAQGGFTACPEFDSSVIVDQSVLVDAERAITGPEREPEALVDLRSHLKWIRELDSIAGYAIGECQEGPGGPVSAARLRSHWSAWMSSDPMTVEVAELRARAEEHLQTPPVEGLVSDEVPLAGRGLSILNYLSVLEAARLYRPLRAGRFRADERISAWRWWCERMNEFAGFSGHAVFTIAHLFLDRGKAGNNAAALLKLHRGQPPTLAELRGAAFDLLYPALCDMAQEGVIGSGYRSRLYVVTADKLLAEFRAQVALVGQTGPTGRELGMLSFDRPYLDGYSARQRRELDQLDQAQFEGSSKRDMLITPQSWEEWQCKMEDRVDMEELELLRTGLVQRLPT